ncbi:MAG: HAD hydrolase-like protein [Synergistaceae bacterium]|jgi:phosphoglycolate phosphatase-like HAD superfamily hydrolase|nr:HAD hydrolase-like protein [Synergistaceae bacterium]
MTFRAPFWSPSHASAILFDWDGIIAKTHLDFSEVREKYYGSRSSAMLLEDSFTLSVSKREALMRDIEEIEMRGANEARPVQGIFDLLAWVDDHHIPWAVVSRNCRESILAAAKRIGVKLPPVLRSRDDGDSIKPDPSALIETCGILSASPSQTVLIGDYIYDMMGARRAGMRGVLVRNEADIGWKPWIECHYPSMLQLSNEMLHPTELVPWEYLDTFKKFGPEFLRGAYDVCLSIPCGASPNLDTWVLRAAALGVGGFVTAGEVFSPDMWRKNSSFDPSFMGMSLDDTLRNFLRTRYPFARVIDSPNDCNAVSAEPCASPPTDAGELQDFIISLLKDGR